MSYIGNSDFLLEVAKGNVAGHSFVHKFGRNTNISTSLVPVSLGGIYQTPTAAVSLEFVSSATTDALNSTGMHEITIEGLDANWDLQSVTTAAHATNGQTAVNISGTWLRVFRAYITKSGAYASASTSSHAGTITVRIQGAGTTYATIPLEGSFGLGQSLIGAYTVPNGYTAYILTQQYSSDVSGTKTTDFYFFKRENADDVASSYTGVMRLQQANVGTQGAFEYTHKSYDPFPAKTDIGFLAKASGTTDASVEFELLLVAD
jgi:hypothetical protein